MKTLTLITAFILVYLLLGSEFFGMPLWLRASLAAITLITSILLSFTGKQSGKLLSFKKATYIDYLIVVIAILISTSALTIAFLKGPEISIKTRNQLVSHLAADAAKDEKSEAQKEEKITRNPLNSVTKGVENGNEPIHDEGSSISIPKRSDLPRLEFPEVYLEPLNERSKAFFAKGENYLRSRTMTKFDGKRWDFDSQRIQFQRARPDGWVYLTDPKSTDPYHYKIHRHAKFKLLLAAQGLERVKLPYLRSVGNAKHTLPQAVNKNSIRQYEAYSSPKNFRDIEDSTVSKVAVGKIDPRYTQVNFNGPLNAKIKQEADKLRQVNGYYQRLEAIRIHLAQNCNYSLQVENPGNYDPIENFLFHERKGFCLHYATVTTLFCRELGIPARVAIGYTGGKYFPHKNWHVFYTKNLHAWTEIYLKDYGWVIFDTSPAQAQISEIATQADKLREIPKSGMNPDDESIIGNLNTPDSIEEQKRLDDSLAQIKWMLVIMAGLAVLLAACGIWQKKSDRKKRGQENSDDERRHYNDKPYIKLFKTVCQLNGKPMMDADTLRSHLQLLKDTETPPEFAEELLNYHYQTTYQQQKADKRIESQLMKRIKRWKI